MVTRLSLIFFWRARSLSQVLVVFLCGGLWLWWSGRARRDSLGGFFDGGAVLDVVVVLS